MLHHIWQHRTREWPNQEISDGLDLARLARRHPRVAFILAHLGGGGDWAHTLPAVRRHAERLPRPLRQRSGSRHARRGAHRARRTAAALGLRPHDGDGLAKLRALDVIGLAPDDMRAMRCGNAMRLFRSGRVSALRASRHDRLRDVHRPVSVPARAASRSRGARPGARRAKALSGAWVGYLPAAWQRDPPPANEALLAALAPHRDTLQPAPVVRPDWPRWEHALRDLVEQGAPAVRAYPMHWGMGPHDASMRTLALACGELGVPLLLTVRFEDLRQRSPLDVAGDLTGPHIRSLARAGDKVRLVVTGAGRELLEETHWGLTPEEQRRVHWDFAWVWGPPEDHLAQLFAHGRRRALRLRNALAASLDQNPRANLDLLPERSARAGDRRRRHARARQENADLTYGRAAGSLPRCSGPFDAHANAPTCFGLRRSRRPNKFARLCRSLVNSFTRRSTSDYPTPHRDDAAKEVDGDSRAPRSW